MKLRHVLGIIAALLSLTASGLALSRTFDRPAQPSDSKSIVVSFNNGFSDSKQDDCQQGFQAACAWLKGK